MVNASAAGGTHSSGVRIAFSFLLSAVTPTGDKKLNSGDSSFIQFSSHDYYCPLNIVLVPDEG